MINSVSSSQQSDVRDVTIIHRPPQKRFATQTVREQRRCAERVQQNQKLYETMNQMLFVVTGGQLTMKTLLPLAKHVANAKRIKIDRDAIRMKANLICWFCENVGIQSLDEKHDEMPVTTPEESPDIDSFLQDFESPWWNFDYEES
jgi:hypothetical protein